MYFNFLPDIKYDQKPISYPFSESDYVVAKNFFRRYKISDTAFTSSVYFNKYAIQDGQRLDQLSQAMYGTPNYDWVIILTNNMTQTVMDMPMSENELRKHVESQYDNPYYDVAQYKIISNEEQIEKFGKVLMPQDTVVDATFYNNKRTLVNDTFPDISDTVRNEIYDKEFIFAEQGNNYFQNNHIAEMYTIDLTTYGSGTGEDGGFVLFSPRSKNGVLSNGYLRFRGDSTPLEGGNRWVRFKPVDTRDMTDFIINGKFGNDINGGEYCEGDSGDEKLRLQYRNDPNDPWTQIDYIIDAGVLQNFQYIPDAPQDLGFGGPGRPEGVYEDIPLYLMDDTVTSARATVTVASNGDITDITLLDRGIDIPQSTFNLKILNSDIGDGFYNDINGVPEANPDLVLFDAYVTEDPLGQQYSRYGTEPFKFPLSIPAEARTEATEFRLLQENVSGTDRDQYGIQSIIYRYNTLVTIPTKKQYVKIDDDNYVIDGQRWTRENDAWYRVVSEGYRYFDGTEQIEISGSELSRPVTQFEYEQTENEKKREIYLLKPEYVDVLIDDFRKASKYKKSSDYVSNRLKQTGV